MKSIIYPRIAEFGFSISFIIVNTVLDDMPSQMSNVIPVFTGKDIYLPSSETRCHEIKI